jgi:hypothetical protein
LPVGWTFALQRSADLRNWSSELTFFTTNEVQRIEVAKSPDDAVGFFRLISPP